MISIDRPKRSRLARFLADSDLDWRAETCTKLLVEGYVDIRDDGERVTAREIRSSREPSTASSPAR